MKTSLAIIATVIAIIAYIPYFKNIFAGKTKPHTFSWFIWFLLTAIAFFAQISDKGGPGAWVTGFTALVCFTIFSLSINKGEKNIVKMDWFSLVGALLALGLWAVTDTPLFSVILITLIDALGFLPTFRKSFYKPNEETALTYGLSAVKFAIAIAALENLSIITVLYPASLVLMNGLFVGMVLIRRNQGKLEINHPV